MLSHGAEAQILLRKLYLYSVNSSGAYCVIAKIFKPQGEKIHLMSCASCENSNQLAYPFSLVSLSCPPDLRLYSVLRELRRRVVASIETSRFSLLTVCLNKVDDCKPI